MRGFGSNTRPAPFGLTTVAAACLVIVVWSDVQTSADDGPSTATRTAGRVTPTELIRERRLPVGKLSTVLSSDWQPMNRADYRALLNSAKPLPNAPRTTTIDRAEYYAVLTEDTLEAGRLAFRVKHLAAKPELFVLDPLNLAVTDLGWKRRRAVWGTIADGRMAVLVDKPSGLLSGTWTLKGRRLHRRIDFRVKLTPATVSQMNLQVPAGWMLESSAGQVTGPYATATVGWTSWRIDLGSRSSFRLVARRQREIKPSQPVVLVQSDIEHEIRQDVRQVKARFLLEVSGAPTDHLTLGIPENVNVLSVTYGNEVKLQYRMTEKRGGERLLRVSFAEPIFGKSRSITVQAVVEGNDGKRALPQIRPYSGAFLSGVVHVRVGSPLAIQSLAMTGMRQVTPINGAKDGEAVRFEQWSPDAELRLVAAHPKPTQQARVASYLDLTGEEWSLQTQIDWSVKNGSTFSVECGLLAGWNVKQVRVGSATDERPERVQADWTLKQDDKGRRVLLIDLPDSLRPGEPISIAISAARPPQLRFHRLQFPVLRPLRCESVRHVIGVRHRSAPVLSDRFSRFWKPIRSEEVPKFARQMGAMTFALAAVEPPATFFQSDVPVAPGFLSLNGGRPIADARVSAIVKPTAQRIQQQIAISIKPVGGPIRQVLVYLPSQDRKSAWRLRSDDGKSLTAVRQPQSRHKEWNLPTTGELWEVKLTVPTAREFGIVLDRDAAFNGTLPVDLAFVPEARSFRGVVKLVSNNNAAWAVETTGLRIAADPPTKPAKPPQPAGAKLATFRRWKYQSTNDRMMLTSKTTKAAAIATAALRLVSVLSDEKGLDVHAASFHINPTAFPGDFQFTLPAGASLVGVSLNGNRLKPIVENGASVIRQLPAERTNLVEIQFRLPSAPTSLRSKCRAAIPQTLHTITGFEWKFALPPQLRLAKDPTFGSLSKPLSQPSWTKRLFGPIGRTEHETVFNPFLRSSWQGGQNNHPAQYSSDVLKGEDFAPIGWNTYQIHAAALVDPPAIEIWDQVAARRIAWVVLLGCLTIGLLMRRMRIRQRGRIAAFWITLCLVGAWVVSGIYAEIVGSGLIGAVMAALIPRNLIVRRRPASTDSRNISLGSTASYAPGALPTSVIFFGVLGTLSGSVTAHDVAQLPTNAGDRQRSAAKTDLEDKDMFDTNTVLIPDNTTDGNGPSLVYVHKTLLARLRAFAANRSPSTNGIIRSAEYRLRFDERNSASVEARLHVDVLASNRATGIALPFHGVALDGADACRVNGRVQPVRRGKNGQGFIVDLMTPGLSSTNPQLDKAMFQALRGTLALGSPTVAMAIANHPITVTPFEVSLRFRVAVEGDHSAGRLKFGIPSVAASRMVFDTAERLAFAEIATAQGRASINGAADRGSITVELGRTPSVQAAWSVDAKPKKVRPQADASVFTFVEVHPVYLNYRFHIRCRPRTGTVDSAVLNLPRHMMVRQVGIVGDDNGIDSFDVVPHDNRHSKMLVQLTEPRKAPFVVEVTATLPLSSRNLRKRDQAIPVFDLFSQAVSELEPSAAVISVVANHLGIQSSPEFDLKLAAADDGAAITTVPAEARVTIEGLPPGIKRVYQVRRPTRLPFELIPRLPARMVRQNQVGWFHRGYLEWMMTARIETTIAPAMIHELIVDPKLRIDSISVVEDKAPRLLRWSRNGKRITLFLKTKTTAFQTITVKARLPLSGPGTTQQLPDIRFADAVTGFSEVLINRDADCLVELSNLPPGENPNPPAPADKNDTDRIHVAAFELATNTSIPLFRIDALSGGRRIDTLTFLDSPTTGRWTVSMILRPANRFRSPAEFRVRIPAEFGGDLKVLPKSSLLKTDRRPDDSMIITLRPPRANGRNRIVTIVSTLAELGRRERVIPFPELLDASFGDNFLAMSSALTNVSVMEPLETLTVEKSVNWIRTSLAARGTTADGSVFRRDTLPWTIARSRSTATTEAYVALMETQIAFGENAVENGRTTMLLIQSNESAFNIRVPEGTTIRAAVVNGKPIHPDTPVDQVAAIPLVAGRSVQTVELHWQRTVEVDRLPVQTHNRTFPRPESIPVRKSVLSAPQVDSAHIYASASVDSVGRLHFLLERTEGLLDACDADTPSDDRRPTYWDTARGAYFALKRARQIGATDDETTKRLAKRLQHVDRRFDAMRNSLRGLPIPDNRMSPAESPADALAAYTILPADEHGFYAVWPVNEQDSAFAYWTVDLRIMYWLLGAFAFLVVSPFVRRIVKLETGALLSIWEPASWAALGLIWWICLTPSAVGIGLILIGAVRAIVRRRQRTLHIGDSFELAKGK